MTTEDRTLTDTLTDGDSDDAVARTAVEYPPQIDPDARIEPPYETYGPFERRMSDLSMRLMATCRERIELAALVQIASTHAITASQLWDTVTRFHSVMAAYGKQEEWLIDVLTDHHTVWGHLLALAEGATTQDVAAWCLCEPEGYDDSVIPWSDARRASAQCWLRWQMQLLGHAMDMSILFPGDSQELLPWDVSQAIRHDAAMEWFGSPYAMGAAMASHPREGATGFNALTVAGHWALDAFARATLACIQDRATFIFEGQHEGAALMLGRAELWWMFTKGFVWSMLQATAGFGVPKDLLEHPQIVESTVQALRMGIELLKETEYSSMTSPQGWGMMGIEPSTTIATTSTADLIEELLSRIAAERVRRIETREILASKR
jgi:hypothetical protein